jgi:cell division protein FtsL
MSAAMKPPHVRTETSGGWKSLFRLPAFLLANVAIFLLIGVSTLRESYRGWTVQREIGALEAQAETLEGRKLKLTQLTESLASPDRVEYEARRQLGWKKEGERVVVLSGYQPTTTSTNEVAALLDQTPDQPPESNFVLWWNYFFGQNHS